MVSENPFSKIIRGEELNEGDKLQIVGSFLKYPENHKLAKKIAKNAVNSLEKDEDKRKIKAFFEEWLERESKKAKIYWKMIWIIIAIGIGSNAINFLIKLVFEHFFG